MFESFLKNGSQKLESLNAETVDLTGLSITDPCLGWQETSNLLSQIATKHQENLNNSQN